MTPRVSKLHAAIDGERYAEKLAVTRANAHELLDALEAEGVVCRRIDAWKPGDPDDDMTVKIIGWGGTTWRTYAGTQACSTGFLGDDHYTAADCARNVARWLRKTAVTLIGPSPADLREALIADYNAEHPNEEPLTP